MNLQSNFEAQHDLLHPILPMYPGLVRTEKMLATKAGPRILKSKASETPEYTGRAIVALYLAVSKKSIQCNICIYI